MMEDNIEKALSDILQRVNAERSTVEKDLRKFLDYGVPIDQAKQAVITKYGGAPQERKLKDLKAYERNIAVVGKIITIEKREVDVRNTRRTIYRGLLGDETAVLQFTAWKDFGIQKGDVIRIKNSSTSEWDGQPRLSLSEWTEVERLETNIDLIERSPQHFAIVDLKPGLSNVEIKGKIISIEPRAVSIGDSEKQVFSGIVGDKTAKIRYTAWHDFDLHESDVVIIKRAYVKKWRGAPQLIVDEKSTVEKQTEDLIVHNDIIPLYKVVEAEGGVDLRFQGTIIEIREGSGIIFRCPKCNRRIRDKVCEEDGEVEGVEDLRIKAIIDDGTGAVDVIIGRELSEKLLGKTLNDYVAIAREAMDYEVIHNDIVDKLLTAPLFIRGHSMPSDFIVTIFAEDVELIQHDIQRETVELLAQIGETT